EEAIASFMAAQPLLSVFASALVGLIPNCAASVVITELYLAGTLGAGAMMAGLLVSAGVGLLVLFRTNRNLRENLVILLALYLMGVAWGLIITAVGITF
ncbi:MAG: arsenic efflux protein, partial [Raoultibacter sp.]